MGSWFQWLGRPLVLLALAMALGATLLVTGAGGARHSAPGGPAEEIRTPDWPPAVPAWTMSEQGRETAAVRRLAARVPFVRSGGGRRREVALTFDDGPGPYSLRLLGVLRRLHVPATFFTVGFMERWFHRATAAEAQAGEVIGDHTQRHERLGGLPAAAQARQVGEERGQVDRIARREPELFRPPFGSFDAHTLALLRRRQMLMVLWSVDSEDYLRPGVPAIVRRVLAHARPGAIVLLHDAGGDRSQTIAALPAIVRGLRRRHLRPVTVPRLLADDPPPGPQALPASLHGG